jgi:ribonuclease D
MLSIKIAKSASFTRWDARPLSPEQLAYARGDVAHLLELALALESKLERLGRLQWARQECEPLQRASDARDPDAIFPRLPRVHNLSQISQAVARELVHWRERTAERRDRPAQSVMQDAVLVEVAKRRPGSARELAQIRGVGQALARRGADEVLAAIRSARAMEDQALPKVSHARAPKPGDAALVALCEALVRMRARHAGLAYELLATRAELQAIVEAARERAGADHSPRALSGWRRELVGNDLLRLLAGELALSVAAGEVSAGA